MLCLDGVTESPYNWVFIKAYDPNAGRAIYDW